MKARELARILLMHPDVPVGNFDGDPLINAGISYLRIAGADEKYLCLQFSEDTDEDPAEVAGGDTDGGTDGDPDDGDRAPRPLAPLAGAGPAWRHPGRVPELV